MPAENRSEPGSSGGPTRRGVLAVVGALGLGGLAGCLGDGGVDTTSPPGTGTVTQDGAGSSPTGTGTGVPSRTDASTPTETGAVTAPETATATRTGDPTETSRDSTATPRESTSTTTATPEQPLGDDPSPLLSIELRSTPPGETTTITGALANPYPFPVRTVEVTMEPPTADWGVSATGPTSFDSIPEGVSRDVAWDVTAPASATGEYTLAADVSYATATDRADVTVDQSVVATTTGVSPIGIDCGGVHTADTVTVDGLQFRPEPAFTENLDIDGTNMVGGLAENARWWTDDDAVDIDPAPNAGVFDTSIEGTEHDDLYRTEHWYGPTDGRYEEGSPLTYTFTLPNGTYDVTLHFAEVWFGGPKEGGAGKKVFTVEINGKPVLKEFDIYAEVGYATALTETFEVEVTDAELTVGAIPIVHNPRFNAIEIHEV